MLLTRKIYKNIISNININRISDISDNIEYKYISKLKSIYYNTIFTPISGHYLIISDFML